MAHWTERHTKKDIVASYEKELTALRDEVERLKRRAEISRLGAWEITKRENTLIAENERLREALTWVSKWKIDETTVIGDLDLHRRVAKEALES